MFLANRPATLQRCPLASFPGRGSCAQAPGAEERIDAGNLACTVSGVKGRQSQGGVNRKARTLLFVLSAARQTKVSVVRDRIAVLKKTKSRNGALTAPAPLRLKMANGKWQRVLPSARQRVAAKFLDLGDFPPERLEVGIVGSGIGQESRPPGSG